MEIIHKSDPSGAENQPSSRRKFLKESAALVTLATAGPFPGYTVMHENMDRSDPTGIRGIQVGPDSFVDEGTENVLDILQKRGAVNTIFLTAFTHGQGLAGRQSPESLHDHGAPSTSGKPFYGGNFATPHPEFYRNTILNDMRAPDFDSVDIIAEVLPAAKKRGIKIFCSVEDVFRSDRKGVKEVAEIDLHGRKRTTLCLFQPDVRSFWTGLVTDLCKSYDIDGILFFNERNGPLLTALGASHFQTIASSDVSCFCEYHRKEAAKYGMDMDRAREGYLKLDSFVQNSLKDQRPSDGYFVEFQRLLLEYPEIVAYDKLFDSAKHDMLEEVRRTVKSINRNLLVGFHIEHVNSFNPFFRATRSYKDLASKADFLKVVVYNNCGGERYANFIRNIGSSIFRDVPKDLLMQFNNCLLNYRDEASFEDLPAAGLSPDYVARETKRALAGVQGMCAILPGIDIGIPVGRSSRKASPDDTYSATLAALRAGAQGIILSRKYSEMPLCNLEAAGKAIREYTRL
jgi:hypothetical protein